MISDEAVEAGVNEMRRFTLHRSPDGVRIFKDGERFEGPWGYREYDAAERTLAAYQLRAALEAALPHLLDREKIIDAVTLAYKTEDHIDSIADMAADRIIATPAHPQKGGEG